MNDCFEEGYQARLDHVPLNHNPFNEGTGAWEEWEDGWLEADIDRTDDDNDNE